MALSVGGSIDGLRGTYFVDSRYREGAFGVTYRGRDLSGGAVILKELRFERLHDWKALELFEREGEVLATLSHPSIPEFRDLFVLMDGTAMPVSAAMSYAGPDPMSFVLVQRFIEGASLQQRLERGELLGPGDAERALRELLGALSYLHERSPPLVHRDIKPGNVILTPDGRSYLVDFGAVQNRLREADSVGSTVVGTLGYMPLEQLRGQASPRSDLYALGMTMVVALTGRPPEQLQVDESSGKVVLDGVLPQGASRGLRDTLDGMLEVLASQRVHSAAEALARLDAVTSPPAMNPYAVQDVPATHGHHHKHHHKAQEAALALDAAMSETLRLHGLWLEGAPLGKRAFFQGASLAQVNLSNARLSKAIFVKASLVQAQLQGADLSGADLSGADLTQAKCAGANFQGANMTGVDLTQAELQEAEFLGTDLTGAKLIQAKMTGAKLQGAKLSKADLTQAQAVDLTGARVWGATLTQASVTGGSLLGRLLGSLGPGTLMVLFPVVLLIGITATKTQDCGVLFASSWDRQGDPPVLVSTAKGELVVVRLRNVGRDDTLFVGAFEGATGKLLWKAGPFGTYSQGYHWTRFVVSGSHVLVTDFHAKAHILDLMTGKEQQTISLTDKVQDSGNLWPVAPDSAGVRPVDGLAVVVDLASGAVTRSPEPAKGFASVAHDDNQVELKELPSLPEMKPWNAFRSEGVVVACYSKFPGTPFPTIVGVDSATSAILWKQPLADSDPSALKDPGCTRFQQAVLGDRFVGVYDAKKQHVTALDTRTGTRQWDVALRPVFMNPSPLLFLSASRVYIGRDSSIEVREASSGKLLGLIGANEDYK